MTKTDLNFSMNKWKKVTFACTRCVTCTYQVPPKPYTFSHPGEWP